VIGFVGVVLIIVGMTGFVYFPPLIKDQVFMSLDITDHESEGYKNFIQPPVPLYMGFNMFHVNNPEKIKRGAKPSVTEIGPFVYQEFREKRNVTESDDGCSVKAEQYKTYKFDPEKTRQLCPSCGDARTTKLTMINAAYVGILQFIREGFTQELGKSSGNLILYGQVQNMIDRISCAVKQEKWNDVFIDPVNLLYPIEYPKCEHMGNNITWEDYRDDLFIDVTVDDFLFQGYESGAVKIMQEQLIGNWSLDDPNSPSIKNLTDLFGWTYPLVRKPYVVQNGTDGVFRFAALNTKNGTNHNENYEIDTGKCGPRTMDNWWLEDPESSSLKDWDGLEWGQKLKGSNDMINYMQIKQWGPEADNLGYILENDILCHPGEQSCFENPTEGDPYGDFGWWTQNNGFPCLEWNNGTNGIDNHRDYCIKNSTTGEFVYDHANTCNWPRGTDGQQFHPYIKKEDRLWIFQTDICRSLYMDYKDDVNFMGFDTYKFVVPKQALKMETEYNLGFCKEVQRGVITGDVIKHYHKADWTSCVKYPNEITYDTTKPNPEDTIIDISDCKNETWYDMSHDCLDGIMDISKCMEGAAVTISSPHFYQSDPRLWMAFDGISDPDLNPERYETYMYVEKYTGAALSLHKRIQFNIPLHKDEHSAYMSNLKEPHYLFPMFWIEEFADLDNDYKEKLNNMLYKPLNIIAAAQWTMLAVGVMLLILMIILFVIHFCCKSERSYGNL